MLYSSIRCVYIHLKENNKQFLVIYGGNIFLLLTLHKYISKYITSAEKFDVSKYTKHFKILTLFT